MVPAPPAPASPAVAARPTGRFIALWALAAGAVMFALGACHDDFPVEYHPDEPSKVAQLIAGTWNYHHPPLMLTLAAAAARFSGVAPQPQPLARVGRLLSALYLGGAVALLTVLAGLYGDTRGSVGAAAIALALDAQAVLAGHFFKEDALLMLALALTFVAGAVHWRRRGLTDRMTLGGAAGLALSSKYIGLLAVVYALTLAGLAALDKRRRSTPARVTRRGGVAASVATCALGIVAMVALCNGPALWAHFAEIRAGWQLGVATAQAGNGGIGAQVPHLQFVGMFFAFTPIPVLLGAAFFWTDLCRRPFLPQADRWLAGLSPLWLTAVFSFSASTAVRYFLPVSLLLGCLGGAALPGAVRWVGERLGGRVAPLARPAVANACAAALLLVFSLPGVVSLLRGFSGDDRVDLARWMAAHLPAHAVVAEDAMARLPTNVPGDERLLTAPTVADLGDLDALRKRGVGYVVVCWYDSRRYVDPHKRPGPGADDYLRRREFYASLQAGTRSRSLWKSELRQPFPLRPGLELFALDP